MRYRQGNRGMAFEQLVNIANTQYANKGIAIINKRPTPVKVLQSKGTQVLKGFYEAKSTVDYDGIYQGQAITFEAKSVAGKRFDLKNLHDHQIEYLIDAEKHGAISFLLIEFREFREIYYTPLGLVTGYWKRAKQGGRKSIPIDDFQIYGFEVEQGRGVALDYLTVVDRVLQEKAVSM